MAPKWRHYESIWRGPAAVRAARADHPNTGEDVAEISIHGSTIVAHGLLAALLAAGARLARPGEFTERAFMNNKLDLAQAESVADIIDASSEAAAKAAARTLTGEFSPQRALRRKTPDEKGANTPRPAGSEGWSRSIPTLQSRQTGEDKKSWNTNLH